MPSFSFLPHTGYLPEHIVDRVGTVLLTWTVDRDGGSRDGDGRKLVVVQCRDRGSLRIIVPVFFFSPVGVCISVQ
jgi:hypothetical protein